MGSVDAITALVYPASEALLQCQNKRSEFVYRVARESRKRQAILDQIRYSVASGFSS